MRLFVVAGHSREAPGARAYNGIYEHTYTMMYQRCLAREHVIQELEGSVLLDPDHLALRDVIEEINSQAMPGDYGLDIHFNNNNPQATGIEVFVHPQTTRANKQLASKLVRGVSNIINIPVRRYHGHRDYKYPAESNPGRLAIIEDTNIPFILVEYCFLNETDLPKFLGRTKQVAAFNMHLYKEKFKSF